MKSFSFAFAFILTVFANMSCSTAKISSNDLGQVKSQVPPEGKSLVYIVRPSSLGYAVTFNVLCDDKSIGSTNGKRFIYSFLEPGLHKFVSKAENKSELFLELESGKTYFLEQKAKMGLVMARTEFVSIDESVGRKLLKSCKLSGDCLAYSKK